jgi:hypothetical protein
MHTEIISWTDGILDDRTLDLAEDSEDAAFLLDKNRKEFVWNIIRGFEGIPVTLPQTSAILDGFSVDNLSISDLLKIRRYGEGVDLLCRMVRSGDFAVNKSVVCALHGTVSRDEIRDDQRGRFRTSDVGLKNVSFHPPHPVKLDGLWREDMFSGVQNPLERGAAVFLYMSRAQFFRDANKRTGMLVMNGIMASAGLKPFFVPDAEKGRFSLLLAEFYETGEADGMMNFMADMACPEESAPPRP